MCENLEMVRVLTEGKRVLYDLPRSVSRSATDRRSLLSRFSAADCACAWVSLRASD